jgi:hypothetical protein
VKIIDYNPKIHPKAWRGKTNFVDKNNVVVGFDDESQCCENFGWFCATHPKFNNCDDDSKEADTEGDLPETYDVEPYVFDTTFDDGGIFRLTADGLPNVYLVLYNHHNGYYSHGFCMSQNERVIHSGSL